MSPTSCALRILQDRAKSTTVGDCRQVCDRDNQVALCFDVGDVFAEPPWCVAYSTAVTSGTMQGTRDWQREGLRPRELSFTLYTLESRTQEV